MYQKDEPSGGICCCAYRWVNECHVVCWFRPAHALYFAVYEHAKDWLGGNAEGHHPVATATAGISATLVNEAVMTPVDVVKQRLQASMASSGVVGQTSVLFTKHSH